eukprot:6176714-Pleurochrysis_carterae.AAC.2
MSPSSLAQRCKPFSCSMHARRDECTGCFVNWTVYAHASATLRRCDAHVHPLPPVPAYHRQEQSSGRACLNSASLLCQPRGLLPRSCPIA